MNKFANWRSVRFASWFDQVDPKVVEVPDEPVMKDINPRLQDMYMPPVEEEPSEDDKRWTVEPTAFDLWSVHGSSNNDYHNELEHHYWSNLTPEIEYFIDRHASRVNDRFFEGGDYPKYSDLPPACDVASLEWMKEFYKHGIKGAKMMSGNLSERDDDKISYPLSTDHVWIQFPNGGIFDPTASQFVKGNSVSFNPNLNGEIRDEYYRPSEVSITLDDFDKLKNNQCIYQTCDNYGGALEDSPRGKYCFSCGEDYNEQAWGHVKKKKEARFMVSAANWRKVSIRKEPDPNQVSMFEDPADMDQWEADLEQKAKAEERARTSPLSEKFRFVTQPAKRVNYGDTCMNNMMTCQYGGKIQAGQPLVHVIDRNTNKVIFRFHPDDEVGSSCKRNATEYLHEFIQRKPE